MKSTTNVAPRIEPETKGFAQARDAWLSRCLADRRLAHSAKTLCSRLNLYFNREHFEKTGDLLAWPRWETLMAETGLGRASVHRLLKQLERLGAFDVEHGRYNHETKKRATNRYLVPKSKATKVSLVRPDQGLTCGTRLNEKKDSMIKKEREKHKMGLPVEESKPSTDSSGPSSPLACEVPRPQGGWWDRLDEPPLLTGEEQAALGRLAVLANANSSGTTTAVSS